MKTKSIVKGLLLLLLVGSIVYAIFFSGLEPSDLTAENIRAFLDGFGIWGPVVLVLAYSLRPVAPVLPPLPVAIAIGAVYGLATGLVIVSVGATLSALFAFSLARFIGRDYIDSLEGTGKIFEVKRRIESGGWATVMVARFLNVPWDVVSYASGVSRIRFADFLIGTAIPAVPLSFIAVYFGSAFGNIRSAADLLTPGPLTALTVFVAGITLPILLKKKFGGAPESQSEASQLKGS